MTLDSRQKRKNYGPFWRAFRFLWPYWRIVVVSIVSAFFVGLVFTSGMSGMLPIIKILISGQTIQSFVDAHLPSPTPWYLEWARPVAASRR